MLTNTPNRAPVLERVQLLSALLRVAIGWHFLYEGWTKLLYPCWTSTGYLNSAVGPASPFFHWLAANAARVRVIDQLNEWGLIPVGLGLMVGVLIRPAAIAGMILLALYYAAYPPLFAPVGQGASEGSYLIVNKNLVELLALAVVAAAPATSFALERLIFKRGRKPLGAGERASESRRGFV